MKKQRLSASLSLSLIGLLSLGQLSMLTVAARQTIDNSTSQPPVRFVKLGKQDGPQPAPRPAGESMTLLSDGRWLLLGGEGSNTALTAAEIRDNSGAVTRLASGMIHARAWHSATVLPDGKVVIIGGVAARNNLISSAELFDPETQTFTELSTTGLTQRAKHTATLLTDGRVLIAGGSDNRGRLISKVELWDPTTKTTSVSKAKLQDRRAKAEASLQPEGTVALSGGVDESDAAVASAEVYSPETDVISWLPSKDSEPESSRLSFSSPTNGSMEVDTDTRLVLRFSKPLRVETVSHATVKLDGPRGSVPARIVVAESGRLVFVTPLSALAADSTFHLTIDGASDANKQPLIFTSITFKTKADSSPHNEETWGTAPQVIDADSWIPSERNFKSDWRSGRSDSESEKLPALQAAAGETALAGQVRGLSGNALPNVRLQIEDKVAVTDNTGRFLLSNLKAGRFGLTIQGHTASRSGKRYGTFDVLVDIAANKTNVLPYTIWLPVLDDQNAVSLPVPTNREIGVTTPRVPGMEVRIPADAVLRMPQGAHHTHGLGRQELTSISITPIPVDRPPFPLPPGVNDALVFTLQLHGAKIEGPGGEKRRGLRIVYPNYLNLPAGDRVQFWNYDPTGPGWYMYGGGTVTLDRRQVIPDAGVELQSMHCASYMIKEFVPELKVVSFLWDLLFDSDPVDLGTGLFIYQKTDLLFPDVIPIRLTRTYRQNDSGVRSFGKGANNPYDIFIYGDTANYGEIILPDASRVHFNRIPNSSPALYECTNSPTRFYKATMRMITGIGPNGAWEVKLRDGTIYQFGIKVLQGDIFGVHVSTNGLSVVQDRFGNKLTITRDNDFRMSRVTSPNGRWIDFSYIDSSKKIAQATDNTGRVVSYTYDAGERLWKVTDAQGGITEYTYDSNDRMLTVKDPRNIVYLTNEYDPASGRVIRQTQADTGVYQFAYTVDAQGKITQTDVTDPRGFGRRATFDADGYPATDTLALGRPEQQTYIYARQPGTHFLQSITDPLGRATAFTYDALGNTTNVTRLAGTPDAVSATITYEPTYNQIATVTDPLNHTLSFSYDTGGKLTSITNPLNHQTTFTHNSAGQMLTATDPLQRTLQFGYDSGDLVSITDPMGRIVTRYVDSAGRATQVTNSSDQVKRFEFDALNQPTRTTDPAQGTTAFAYDPNGNLLSVTDARNSVTSYIYDNMDRMVTRRNPLLHDETYEYDLNGNLTRLTDRKSQAAQLTYDALNRLTQVTYGDNSTRTYNYDTGNRLTQVVDSLAGTITYGYDNLDRLIIETTPQGSVSYTYDSASRRTSMTVLGQPTVNYTYDNANRLTQITQGSSTVTIAYDDAGRRTSLTLPNGVVTEYGYDQASHLTSLTYKHGANVLGNLTYEYDATGRRTRMAGSFARSITPPPLSSASYNAANQQLALGNQTLSYDLNGNLLSDGTNSYTWDARNRLTSISGPGGSASFQYDAIGRRSSKTVNGTTTSFVYDGSDIVQEQSSQNGNANILNGPVDEVFSRSDAAGTWNPLADGLGSSLSLTDASGSMQTDYSYGAFGQTAATGAQSANSNQYTNRENDGTGLQYNRARYYSPALQRFISEDPIGFGGGLNFYAYVGNDPINFADPDGLFPTHGAYHVGVGGDVHQRSVDRVLGDTLTEDEIQILQEAQIEADNQGTVGESFKHAMTGGRKDPAEERRKSNAWIRANLETARRLNASGNRREALRYLGIAMHTMQDRTSPAHWNFRRYEGGVIDFALHSGEENFDPGAGSNLDKATGQAYEYFSNGQPLPEDFFEGLSFDINSPF